MTILLLFWEFFKAGLFAVGGGLATLPFIQRMMERYPHWFGTLHLADITAVAESTPGPIGVNAATFAGYTAAGVPGAVVASLAVVLPSFIVITLIAGVYVKYRESRVVEHLFRALRPAAVGLVGAAGYAVCSTVLFLGWGGGFLKAFDWRDAALFAVIFLCMLLPKLNKLHPIVYILAGAAFGLLLGA
ncbi:MAG: chromate transporter [Clostridia bacterium]|nr:chromate transporter [Clostridia bacterium]